MSEETNKKPSAEQIAEQREKAHKFYDEQLPLLEKEHKYYKMKSEIEKFKAEELHAMAVQLQYVQGSQEQPELGDDGFPVDWSEEQKAQYREQHETKQEETSQEEPKKKPASKKKPEIRKKRELKTE